MLWCSSRSTFSLSVNQILLATLSRFKFHLSERKRYTNHFPGLTDEAEDVSDGGDEDDQHVVEGQDGGGNQHVASPAELSTAEQQCGDGGADLAKK